MIPVAQLDPASLSLWLNFELVAHHPARESLQECVTHAMLGDIGRLKTTVASLADDDARTRGVHLASAIWHEQRHFLDLVLTNYGAFRVRQFTSIYWNELSLLNGLTKAKQPLYCPITLYANKNWSEALETTAPTEHILQQAADITTRMSMMAEEQMLVATPWGRMQVGGEAQLEALGFLYQFSAVGTHFGPGMVVAVQQDLPPESRGNLRYEWALHVGQISGVLPSIELDEQTKVHDVTLLCAVLLGSLAVRRWGQEQVKNEHGESGYAAARLYGFITALKGRKHDFGGVNAQDAWDEVNDVAKSLWGRSAMEEMEIDFDIERERMEQLEGHVAEDLWTALTEIHKLRGTFFDILRADPTLIVDPDKYAEALLPRLLPLPVQAMPSGMLGRPPNGWERVLGFVDPDDPDDPNGTWVWAAIPSQWPPQRDAVLALRGREAWATVIADYAPLGKLLMNGHRHGTMLGPEIFSIQKRLEATVDLRVHPYYFFPTEGRNAAHHYYFLTGRDSSLCDLCRTRIGPANSWIISPWRFRMSVELANSTIEGFGGGREGYLKYLRDWSPWVVCERCNGLILQMTGGL